MSNILIVFCVVIKKNVHDAIVEPHLYRECLSNPKQTINLSNV